MTGSPARTDFTSLSLTAQEQRDRFEEVSVEFASGDAEASDAMLDLLTGDAIKEWRMQDATFWQRVKFRSRMLRAIDLGEQRKTPGAAEKKAGGR
ncbi:MAG: hypothetical protein V4610_25090 [Pseudomonadota bacterium]|jgi:hypothetical protein|uniref:Uncharacterized protein n=1 Tax=hydrothermal vent metagenome TaxID=652676 RepID=A0A170PPP8_9ZZZZ